MTTLAPHEDLTLEAHDWAVPCGYTRHKYIAPTAPATWAVWARPVRPCGHVPKRNFIYLCDPCWTYLNADKVSCPKCNAKYRYLDMVLRTERI